MIAKKYIILSKLKSPTTVESQINSGLLDVAGVSEISNDWARVEVDEGVDLSKRSDCDWIVDLLRQELADCGESEAEIQIV